MHDLPSLSEKNITIIPDWILEQNSETISQYSEINYPSDLVIELKNIIKIAFNQENRIYSTNIKATESMVGFLSKPFSKCNQNDVNLVSLCNWRNALKDVNNEDFNPSQLELIQKFIKDIDIKTSIYGVFAELEKFSQAQYLENKPYYNPNHDDYNTQVNLQNIINRLNIQGIDFKINNEELEKISTEVAKRGVSYFQQKCQEAFNPVEIYSINQRGFAVGFYPSLIANAEIAGVSPEDLESLDSYNTKAKTRTIENLEDKMQAISPEDLNDPGRREKIITAFNTLMIKMGFFTRNSRLLKKIDLIDQLKEWNSSKQFQTNLDIIANCLMVNEILNKTEIYEYSNISDVAYSLEYYKQNPESRLSKKEYESWFKIIDNNLLQPVYDIINLTHTLPLDVERSIKINIENLENAAIDLGYLPKNSLELISLIKNQLNGVEGPAPKFLDKVPKNSKEATVARNEYPYQNLSIQEILDIVPNNDIILPNFIIDSNKDILTSFSCKPDFDLQQMEDLMNKYNNSGITNISKIVRQIDSFLNEDILYLDNTYLYLSQFTNLQDKFDFSDLEPQDKEAYLSFETITKYIETKRELDRLISRIEELNKQLYLFDIEGKSLQDEIKEIAAKLRNEYEINFNFGFEYDDFLQTKAKQGVAYFTQKCLDAKSPMEILGVKQYRSGDKKDEIGFYPALRKNNEYLTTNQNIADISVYFELAKNRITDHFNEMFKDLDLVNNKDPDDAWEIVDKLHTFISVNKLPPFPFKDYSVRQKEDLECIVSYLKEWDLDNKIQNKLDMILEFGRCDRICCLSGISSYPNSFNLEKVLGILDLDNFSIARLVSLCESIERELTGIKALPIYIIDDLKYKFNIIKNNTEKYTDELKVVVDRIVSNMDKITVI